MKNKGKPTSSFRVRPRSSDLLAKLRSQIVQGRIKPGDRMPTRAELIRKMDSCHTTVQAAFNQLIKDGFVETRGSSGSFVSDSPPHLNNVALVVASSVSHSLHSLHSAALLQAAEIVGEQRQLRISPYEVPVKLADMSQPNDMRRLLDDIAHHRVGGVVLATGWEVVSNTPIVSDPNIQRVVFSAKSSFGCPSVWADVNSFARVAVQHLLDQGRQRIAHLYVDAAHKESYEQIGQQLRSIGNEVRDTWIQFVPSSESTPLRAASRIVQLWFDLDGDKRPDAIVVHDDHLVEHVLAGLLRSDVRMPRDVEVVSLANFPSPRLTGLPITRIGFDMVHVLGTCMDLIEQQRSADANTDVAAFNSCTAIPPVFESELATAFNANATHEVAPVFAG